MRRKEIVSVDQSAASFEFLGESYAKRCVYSKSRISITTCQLAYLPYRRQFFRR